MVQKSTAWMLNIVEKLRGNLANFALHHLSNGQQEFLKSRNDLGRMRMIYYSAVLLLKENCSIDRLIKEAGMQCNDTISKFFWLFGFCLFIYFFQKIKIKKEI